MILTSTKVDSLAEIKRAIPSYYLLFDDYMGLQQFAADEMDEFAAAVLKIIENAFILKCDENTLNLIEHFLKISDLSERIANRGVFLNSMLTSIGKLSVSKLKRLVAVAINENPDIHFVSDENHNRVLTFEFNDNNQHNVTDLITLIMSRLPAGMYAGMKMRSRAENNLRYAAVFAANKTSYCIPSGDIIDNEAFVNGNITVGMAGSVTQQQTHIYPPRPKDSGWS